jgi:uncharacterized membrane protein
MAKIPFDLEVNTQRLEAFSDGVFAIAITLLVLEIKIPGSETMGSGGLAHYLYGQWPKYGAYILSFVIIGIYWANHHYLFKLFLRTDHYFNLLNVLFLMSISFLPYPTDVLGEYILNPVHMKTAVTFYSVGILLPAICWCLIWLYASHKQRLINPRLSPVFIRFLTRQYIVSVLLYMMAFLISLFSPVGSILVGIGLTLLYLLPPKKPQFLPS